VDQTGLRQVGIACGSPHRHDLSRCTVVIVPRVFQDFSNLTA
jgi:hypothetical protein